MHLPLFAECKGFNMLAWVKSGVPFWRDLIRTDIASLDEPAPIEWNTPAIDPADTFVFQTAAVFNATSLLTAGANLMNRHPYGILPGNYTANANLTRVFGPYLATTIDARGVRYVSMIQAAGGLPIVGAATHPEKVLFEWRRDLVYPRSVDAIHLNTMWSLLVTEHARRNNRSFEAPAGGGPVGNASSSTDVDGGAALLNALLWYNTSANPMYDARHLMGGEFRQLIFTR